ncbi:hypothetical protein CcaverHIS002_0604950 [Cutaneotrichosporon cavernicola]|uniref:SHSP domain-containing protein n=1 Tax=Cutaneotrichosporon cavernicola TaxID=279322 RepID=A0AA48L8R4_9TREE|nr:uncharacterized protein CcaverHIS019_0604390 [Cutaneotrichosporon cavernicola]BEI86208.1 hypothetical protein CcaverHIS002_0604950 [Cutaneotrichosporon cavernicola]BEI93980.1 hypothetical protein CcaverHIS019_0604390 [Cutaneotrichosporon cavernicola]BEJ01761.1 hypothetical protein CcaverHIS631_0604430 [Cutaneotrichosporon cavernicola]BEJ09528.1 hypothetical protein CcaverHIS641_0604430 [Cutaneotrichosporon cavernicola]
MPKKTSTSDSLAQAPLILRTPELSPLAVNFDQLGNSDALPSRSNPYPGGMSPNSPRTLSQADRQLSVVSKHDHVHKGSEWRKKYSALIGGSACSNDNPASSLHHTDSFKADPSSDVTTTSSTAAAGLYISAPLSPPVGYPMPGSAQQSMRAATPVDDPRASVISSSSSGSSHAGSTKSCGSRPTPPQWAQPPKKMANRASSFDSGLDRGAVERPPVRGAAEHNPEQFKGPAGEWVQILRGEEGRIAIKSTSYQYEVLAWLPHFSINDITIVTRKNHVLHIVADQWDENDHAQWEIRLGDDAAMNSIRAMFSGSELVITVARNAKLVPSNVSAQSDVTMRTASTRALSYSGTVGHHERSFSSPTTSWSENDRRDLEARMSRGAERF